MLITIETEDLTLMPLTFFWLQSPNQSVQHLPVNTDVVGTTKPKPKDIMERAVPVSKDK